MSLPYENASFDVVIISNALHIVAHEWTGGMTIARS